jgi:hypothetical protein
MSEKRQLSDKYKRVPLVELTAPKGGLANVYKDHWWIVTDKDEALFWKGHAPQCNKDKRITDHLAPEGCKSVFVPLAFVRASASDYQ